MNVLLSGSTGFVGSRLREHLVRAGHEVRGVSRGPGADHDWSQESLAAGVSWADAVIHLAGAGIFDRRWSAARKEELVASRVTTTERLATLVAEHRTGRFLTASAVGYYGASDASGLDEGSPVGSDFLAGLCQAWERAAQPARDAGVSTATVRIGVVLGRGSGALAKMLPPFRFGLGGPLGSGRQWMSWVHIDDLCRLFLFLLEQDGCEGAFNGTAPTPERMSSFAKTLGRVLRRPALLPVPGFVLRCALGEVAEVLLTGQHVLPRRALEAGFVPRYPDLEAALRDLT